VFTELREKVGTSEPTAGPEENYESTTTSPDNSPTDGAYEEPYEAAYEEPYDAAYAEPYEALQMSRL